MVILKNILKILVILSALVLLLVILDLSFQGTSDGILGSNWKFYVLSIFLYCVVVFIVAIIILIILLGKYFKLSKLARTELPKSKILQYAGMILFLLAFPVIIYVLMYIFSGSDRGSSFANLPQVCLSAAESVGCKSYYNYGMDNKVVQWCEGYYISANAMNKDPLNIKNVADIAAYAAAAEYETPSADDAKGIRTDNAETKTYMKDIAEAGLLCINPSKGGYLPNLEKYIY